MNALISEHSSFFSDIAPTFERLRKAVRAILDSRPKAATSARACAREFDFDKSIGWKFFQIGYGDDAVTALSALPGARGWEIAMAKFVAAGVVESRMAEVQTALAAFERQLADRRIDRSMLSGMASALVDTEESRRQMLRLRKQASDAMAVIHGVHSSARVGSYFVAPSATVVENVVMADLIAITIAEGLERRRPGPPWPLFDPVASYDAQGQRVAHPVAALQPSGRGPMVEDLSSPSLLDTEVGPRGDLSGAYDFVGRTASRTDPLTVSFAEFAHAVGPLVKSGTETRCELSMPITVPTTVAVLDIMLHRSIGRVGELSAVLFANGVVAHRSRLLRERLRLTLESKVTNPNSLHIAEIAPQSSQTYAELCRRSAAKLGFDLSEFQCHRIVLTHPPVPCTLQMSWELADAS